MRLYCFSHFMLSPMAKGIQSLHSTVELFNKYTINHPNINTSVMLYDWSYNHKTCIVLNAGTSRELNELRDFLITDETYPWATFYEDDSLENIMTSISIVLPPRIYQVSSYMRMYKGLAFIEGYSGYNLKYDDESVRLPIDIQEELLELCSVPFSQFETDLINTLGKYKLAS